MPPETSIKSRPLHFSTPASSDAPPLFLSAPPPRRRRALWAVAAVAIAACFLVAVLFHFSSAPAPGPTPPADSPLVATLTGADASRWDGVTKPEPGGWNRIHLIVDDIDAEVARLRDLGARFRNDIIEGPGGKQVLLQDPSGNVVELFQPAR